MHGRSVAKVQLEGKRQARHGLVVEIPDAADRDFVHRAIYEELCLGQVREATKKQMLDVVARLTGRRGQAVILGCTELGLLLKDGDGAAPLFDSTAIHAAAALDVALK